MERLLQQYLWAVDLVVVVLCATLLGLAASTIVATTLAPVTSPRRMGRSPPAEPELKLAFDKRPDAIVRRNVFCSACPSLLSETTGPREPPTEKESTLPVTLVAVMYAPGTSIGNLSLAVVKDTDSGRIGAFRLGNRIRGAIVADILETRVYLHHHGAIEYLDLLGTSPTRTPREIAAGSHQDRDPIAAELDRGIRKVGEHRYQVQRRTLEAVLENLGVLSRSARPVPEIRDGRMMGFRLFAVRPDGPVARIGLGNGDVITSINGLELSGPDQAVDAVGKLRSASHLSLRFERGGATITNDYDIQ